MSKRNQEYWSNKDYRAKVAYRHIEYMENNFQEEIIDSANRSIQFTGNVNNFSKRPNDFLRYEVKIIIDNIDTVSAIFKYKQGRTAALNFASYKNPGGMFIKGSSAQEECLCHSSTLYNVLFRFNDFYYWNRDHLNNALYLNRAIWSPDVLFLSDHNSKHEFCDIITCAAPNKYAAQKYKNISEEVNSSALFDRINFVLDIANSMYTETLILGAYGCGVFGQDPRQVANIFKLYLKNINCSFERVIFAIPESPNNKNLKEFKKVFGVY